MKVEHSRSDENGTFAAPKMTEQDSTFTQSGAAQLIWDINAPGGNRVNPLPNKSLPDADISFYSQQAFSSELTGAGLRNVGDFILPINAAGIMVQIKSEVNIAGTDYFLYTRPIFGEFGAAFNLDFLSEILEIGTVAADSLIAEIRPGILETAVPTDIHLNHAVPSLFSIFCDQSVPLAGKYQTVLITPLG